MMVSRFNDIERAQRLIRELAAADEHSNMPGNVL
jgi:hypothetical protein